MAVFNAADANSGSYIQFDENATNFTKAVVSSGSMPFVFPSQYWP
jgi:predicted acylesterase/phospholipase RssA